MINDTVFHFSNITLIRKVISLSENLSIFFTTAKMLLMSFISQISPFLNSMSILVQFLAVNVTTSAQILPKISLRFNKHWNLNKISVKLQQGFCCFNKKSPHLVLPYLVTYSILKFSIIFHYIKMHLVLWQLIIWYDYLTHLNQLSFSFPVLSHLIQSSSHFTLFNHHLVLFHSIITSFDSIVLQKLSLQERKLLSWC